MPLQKPYKRIYRPIKNFNYDYVKDNIYGNDRLQLSRSYLNLEHKLIEIFDFIEPSESNKSTFSFELYSLFIRACTEVESNFKKILQANNIAPQNKQYTMKDYKRLKDILKLSQYKLSLANWMDNLNEKYYSPKIITPFYWHESCNYGCNKEKGRCDKYVMLKWYEEYNLVKHNREEKFYLASLDNCITSIAGVLVLLYSQFGPNCIETYGINNLSMFRAEDYAEDIFDANIIFKFEKTPVWEEEEKYDFEWKVLKKQKDPFGKLYID